jgi:hypothetical protein
MGDCARKLVWREPLEREENTVSNQEDKENPRTSIAAGIKRPGEYGPAGEMQGVDSTFAVEDVAIAFGVDPERVRRAFGGEFGLSVGDRIDSRQAQHLAEVILGDRPQDVRQAALMTLGAYTPRHDHEMGAGEADPAEESDSLRDDQPGN